jgi:hypothetical protein
VLTRITDKQLAKFEQRNLIDQAASPLINVEKIESRWLGLVFYIRRIKADVWIANKVHDSKPFFHIWQFAIKRF